MPVTDIHLPAQFPWMVSLHGGHSGDFCNHGHGTLVEILEAAAVAGFHTFGVSEHAPRNDERFLYPDERELGWTVEKTQQDFARYIEAVQEMPERFAGRLVVLRGFEAEVVPAADWAQRMTGYRSARSADGRPAFDYFVGSVHYVNELVIDGSPEELHQAVEACGGPEALAVRYYGLVTEMIEALRPDVVGHPDLIKVRWQRAGLEPGLLTSPAVRTAARRMLEAARDAGAILDLNTSGWRKGLGEPYPAPWIVEMATQMDIGFCFGDDSHRPSDVGAGVADARDYLRRLGVETVTVLTREDGNVVRKRVPIC
jgi:histidinol-phosphatase (PHP family)